MLRYDNSQIVPQLLVDIVRFNDERRQIIINACRSTKWSELSAFLEVYDYHAVVILHRGNEPEHKEFCEYLNQLM